MCAYFPAYNVQQGLGPRSAVDCVLRLYVKSNACGIAQPRDLLAALEAFPPAWKMVTGAGACF